MEETMSLFERGVKATEKFLDRRGYEVIDTNDDSDSYINAVAIDDGDIVFVRTMVSSNIDKGYPSEDIKETRPMMETEVAKWMKDHPDMPIDCTIRFDIISLIVVGTDRALLKHHINAFG